MKAKRPSKEQRAYIRKVISYDPLTGILTRKIRTGQTTFQGEEAGYLERKTGYRRVKFQVDGKTFRFLSHILAWYLHYRKWPNHLVDHADNNPSNNKISNLRAADSASNSMNRGVTKRNKLGIKGVKLEPSGGYRARIDSGGKARWSKIYPTAQEASDWYLREALKHNREFARR